MSVHVSNMAFLLITLEESRLPHNTKLELGRIPPKEVISPCAFNYRPYIYLPFIFPPLTLNSCDDTEK